MLILTDLASLQTHIQPAKAAGTTIGFVPTMGALHAGHLSLIEQAKRVCSLVVCSIYVNPTQFNNQEDLINYPRTVEADTQMLQEAHCDIVFMPGDHVVYPQPGKVRIDFGYLETVMEGKYRPGHFNGVATVVAKLFHMVNPDIAFFGQKDLQQFAVIRQLVQDLSFPLQVVCCPIMRETDGLAMSSRNRRLTAKQRQIAPVLYQTLQQARLWCLQIPVTAVKQAVNERLSAVDGLELEYFEVVNSQTLMPVNEVQLHTQISLCIAAYVGEIRLIDNVFLAEHTS